jgi:hypothetical protein
MYDISNLRVNWLVFATLTEFVYCAVQTKSLSMIQVHCSRQRVTTTQFWLHVPNVIAHIPSVSNFCIGSLCSTAMI